MAALSAARGLPLGGTRGLSPLASGGTAPHHGRTPAGANPVFWRQRGCIARVARGFPHPFRGRRLESLALVTNRDQTDITVTLSREGTAIALSLAGTREFDRRVYMRGDGAGK